MQLIHELVKDFAPLVTVELVLKFFECELHHVIWMSSCKFRIRSYIQPHLVHEFQVFGTHTRGMRAQWVLADGSIRSMNFQYKARPGFGQPLPGISRQLCLFVRRQLVGKAANDAAGTEALCRDHDGFENIASRYHE